MKEWKEFTFDPKFARIQLCHYRLCFSDYLMIFATVDIPTIQVNIKVLDEFQLLLDVVANTSKSETTYCLDKWGKERADSFNFAI